MKTEKIYETPAVEVINVEVEKGFATSPGGNGGGETGGEGGSTGW